MAFAHLHEKAKAYLEKMCLAIPQRRVGSEGNRLATEFFAQTVASFGFITECPQFECIDWIRGDVRLEAGGKAFDAYVSPYSLGCHLRAPLCLASTVEQLEKVEATNGILLLFGDLAKEQLMPKNFPFYNPEEHKRIVRLLETKKPKAIIAATSRNPELAGGVYPFPLIEDGDFNIPSVYMTEEEGARLAHDKGREINLDFDACRIPAKGYNVIAFKGDDSSHRVVLCAHIDSKEDTPGALDNASGVVVLLLLAELLQAYCGSLGIELVALNGEDYYSSPGQIDYLNRNSDRMAEIILAINLDLPGYKEGRSVYSFYDCPDGIVNSARKIFSSYEELIEGEPWYQSDHMIFVQNQRPALAITSERFVQLSTYVTHTAQDKPELVDCNKLIQIASALRDLLMDLEWHRS